MGHYASDYESAAADLVDYYGQPISYVDPSLGSPVTVDAKTYPEIAVQRQNNHGWYWVQTRRVVLLNSDVTVRRDGAVTIGSDQYSVESVGTKSGEQTELMLTRASAGEVTRPGYRGTM